MDKYATKAYCKTTNDKSVFGQVTKIGLQQIGSVSVRGEITKKLTSVRRYAECKTKYIIFTRTFGRCQSFGWDH